MRLDTLSRALLVVAVVALPACSKQNDQDAAAPESVVLAETGFRGWNSLTLDNAYARMDVVPELGGKIMGYELRGYQFLWHDATARGQVVTDQGYGWGQKFTNPGGAKVWPAPQGWSGQNEWPGPPDNVLDGSPYEAVSTDSLITVTSPRDDGEGRTGLQFAHSYRLEPHSSIVRLNLSMTNVVNRPVTWGLWHLATVPVDRNATVYVPANKGDWHVIYGDKESPQWQDGENGMFQARYAQKVGKVGVKVRDGWAVWFDEDRGMAFVMMFPVKKGAQYPDGGSHFEIWTTGAGTIRTNNQDTVYEYKPETAMMELEVMGPLTRLNPGETATMDLSWASCRCSGVTRVSSGGVVAQPLQVADGMVRAKFGVFYGGYLQAVYLDRSGRQVGLSNVGEVSPLTEITVERPLEDMSGFAAGVRYQVQSYDKQTVGVIDQLMFKK